MLFYGCMWGPDTVTRLLAPAYEFHNRNSEFQSEEVKFKGTL